MPEERIVTAEQLQKDEDDFDAIFNDIADKTDEEIRKDEADQATNPDDKSGETTKDQDTGAQQKTDEDPINPEKSGQDPDNGLATSNDGTDWKAKAESLEAELGKERQRTSSWDGRIKAANEKSKSLEAEVKMLREKLDNQTTNKKTEEEQSDQEVMEKFKETFPELVEVVDIMQKKVDAVTKPTQAKDPEPDTTKDDLDPDNATSDDNSDTSRKAIVDMKTVRKEHPDVDEAVSSGKIVTWINTQPDYMKPTLENVYYGANGYGSTQQVIDLMANFKKQTGWKSSLTQDKQDQDDKLKGMLENEGGSGGPIDKDGPSKNDFDGAAKEAGL